MLPRKKTSWVCVALWTLALVLISPRVESVNDIEDVPEGFQHLENYRVVFSGTEERNQDLRAGNQLLRTWKETSYSRDYKEKNQVVSKTMNGYDKEVAKEISKTGIDQQIIVRIGSDQTVQNAGDYLFNKKTNTNRPKVLLEFVVKSGQFKLVKLEGTDTVHITENTKISVVGHGGQREGRVSVGGETSEQLAKVILKLREPSSQVHWPSGLHKVEEISIVSCDVGAGEEGKTFAKDFLLGLDNARLSVGSLSVRTTKTIVQEDGSKVTVDFDDPEHWGKHIPDHKRKFYLGKNKDLIEVSNTKERSPEWIESQSIGNELDPLGPRTMENNPLYYYDNGLLYHIDDEHIGQGIDETVRGLFNTEGQHVDTQPLDVYYKRSIDSNILHENIQVQVVDGLESLKNNIQDIIRSSNDIRRQKLMDKANVLRRYQIRADNNMNLKETWKVLSNLRDNRQIRLIYNDIQNTLENTFKYYRFKDYIYRINLKDFYVTLYGTTDENLFKDSDKSVEFCDLRNIDHVAYPDMNVMRNTRSFSSMAQKWVRNNHNNIGEINGYDGIAVLATHISEAVRNPKMFMINRLLWDVEATWGQFRYRNPMTRGDTWKGNPAAIGLSYETTEPYMNEQVAQETTMAMKLWLTRKYREMYYDYKPKDLPEPIEMSSVGAKEKIRGECERLPLYNSIIDVNCRKRPGQLSEDLPSYFHDLEERARGKSLETELHLKIMEDKQQLVETLSNKIKEQVSEDFAKNWRVKSIENYESGTKAIVEDIKNPSVTSDLFLPGEIRSLRSEEVLHSYFNDVSGYNKVNHGLAIYGTLMGFQGANQMFAEGRKWEGGVMLAQGVHGVTEMTGINSAVNKIAGNIAQKSISQISTGLEEASAVKFTSALAEAGELAKAVPILSLGFTVFNIYEDLHQGTTIGIVDAALDGAIFITALAGPEMLPVTVVLSIVRLAIDPMYNEIKHELDALPPDASVGDKFVAVVKGIGLALRDIGNSFVQIWEQISIPGVIYNVYNLEQEHKRSMDIIHNLQTAENYYKILDESDGDVCHKKIDFTQGEKSAYGGKLHVELTDHSSVIITLTDPLTSNRIVKEIPFEKDCELVDLVMGIGEGVNIKLTQKTATLLWFIPVKTKDVISSLTPDDKSLHGTYVGNSKPNRFYAVQQNVIEGLSYTLDKYHYELYGNDGNDIFYLGPQKTFVHGGNGQDVYYIPNNAGQTEICNQADDKEMDLLIFHIPLRQIYARKVKNDLKLFNNNLHEILIKNWFSGEEYRHMSFKSMDGALFKVGEVKLNGIVPLEPYTLDFSSKDSGAQISLEDPLWKTVVAVIGSNHSDNIQGNHLNNVLQGRGGKNDLAGRDGKDMYIIQEKQDCDTINNFANDDLIDIVELPGSYADLRAAIVPLRSLKIWDSKGKTCVIMKDWNRGWQWQHIILKSKDFVLFQITNTSKPELIPLILDYSDSTDGIDVDLNSIPGNENIMTVIGSSHYDNIKGNNKPNFIQGGKGGGRLTGRGGSDTYVIDCKKGEFIIDNYSEDDTMDILFIKAKYSSLNFNTIVQSSYFDINVRKNLRISVNSACDITLLNWHSSERYRHLQIWTEDGITFSIPRGSTPVIFAVDNSRDTLPISVIDTRSGIYEGATKIMGPPRFINIYGNEKNNYIDPETQGASMTGGEGSDTYVLRKHYEGNYEINNYAEDEKVDYIILDINYKDIQFKVGNTFLNAQISAPRVARWQCRLLMFGKSKNQRHLIVKTNDVWFTFSDSLEIQTLFVDERSMSADLHLDLSSKSLHSVPTVYGSLQRRNFITGNSLNNTMIGGKDIDVLYGLEGNDVLQGSRGKDYLSGGAGDDKIHGGEGNDLILGGEGDDVIYPGLGGDTVYGGSGSDTLLFFGDHGNETGVYVNLYLGYGAGSDAEGDLYSGMENVVGTSYDDILIGNYDSNYIRGAGGNDLIQPLGGFDFLQGGEGEDIYNLIDATGIKMIDNFASDGKADDIYVDYYVQLEISQQRSQDDLHITINYKNDEELKVIVKNWFKSEKYRHLTIKKILKRDVTRGMIPCKPEEGGMNAIPVMCIAFSD
ncbi:uncharacterized protein LOC120979991 [Bufo bufo]|uniref:uncharacterized protein LOC120979991 n=1 Tax=Bufo bufo TaxID=8384 RepID=UPI001ABE5D24|nr:uncharacterized protein LOC120979991 [Bufo bufo]